SRWRGQPLCTTVRPNPADFGDLEDRPGSTSTAAGSDAAKPTRGPARSDHQPCPPPPARCYQAPWAASLSPAAAASPGVAARAQSAVGRGPAARANPAVQPTPTAPRP